MRPLVVVPLVLGCLVAGFAVGYLVKPAGPAAPASVGVESFLKPKTTSGPIRTESPEVVSEMMDQPVTVDSLVTILSNVQGLSPEQIRTALESLEDEAERSASTIWIHNGLVMQWTELDPHAALAFALEEDAQGGIRYGTLATVMTSWAEKDTSAALAAAQGIEEKERKAAALNAMVNILAKQDPRAALSLVDFSDRNRLYSVNSIFREWAKHDPKAARRAIDEIDDDNARRFALQGYYSYLASRDPEATANEALYSLEGQDQRAVFGSLFGTWRRKDIDAALAYVGNIQDANLRNTIIEQNIWQLADQEPEKVFLWAQQYLTGDAFSNATRNAISQMANKDPRKALDFAGQYLKGNDYSNALSGIVGTWARKDLDAALLFVQEMPEGQAKGRVAQSLTWQLADIDPERGFTWALENIEGSQLQHISGQMVQKMAEQDPLKAARMVEQLPFGESYSNAVRNLASAWTKSDPQGAVQWIYSLPEGPDRTNAFNNFASTYADNDPELALSYAQQFPEGPEKEKLILAVAGAKVKSDPGAAMQWARSLSDEKLRGKAQYQAISRWVNQDSESALNYMRLNPDFKLDDNQYRNLARSMAYNSPSQAATWSLSLEGEAQKRAIDSVTEQWLRQDTYAASVWIAQLPESPARQEALVNLVDATYRSEPDAAFDWSLALTDEKQRKTATQRVVNEWKGRNQSAAWQAVQSSTLPQEEKEALLNQLKD